MTNNKVKESAIDQKAVNSKAINQQVRKNPTKQYPELASIKWQDLRALSRSEVIYKHKPPKIDITNQHPKEST